MKYIFIILALIFVGCDKPQSEVQGDEIEQVLGITIKPKNLAAKLQFPARLRNINTSDVYARVDGVLIKQHFKEGDFVKEGDLLFSIEPSHYQALYDSALAAVQNESANFERAKRDWERIEDLYNKKIITIDVYDTSAFNFKSAKANLDSARAALKNAELNLSYTSVKASISGRIGTRNYDIGNLVGNGNNVLATITQTNPIYADFSIPRNYIERVKSSDLSITITTPSGTHKGVIDFLDSSIDTQTASLRARAVIENPDSKLIANDFGEIVLENALQNALTIPQSALMQDNSGSFVFVAKPAESANIVERRSVEVGEIVGSEVVILSGVKSGERILLERLGSLKVGMEVSFRDYNTKQSSQDSTHISQIESNKTESNNIESSVESSQDSILLSNAESTQQRE